jgi:NAD+ diphosphatase
MESDAWWFAFRGSELLVREDGSAAAVPGGGEWEVLGLAAGRVHSVGRLVGRMCWAVELTEDAEPPAGFSFQGLRRLWGLLEEEAWRIAGRAVQILDWDRNHRFCGRCGGETVPQETELARKCSRCGLQHFPRLSPAVIVRVERGEEILLARSPHFAPGVYSTLAGFVEPGESLEGTLHREILEEVGITVTNLRYFGSQPWPFPNSLMIGFVADYLSGELTPQPGEIEDAGWFTVDNLPGLPSRLSIARALIDEFIERRK